MLGITGVESVREFQGNTCVKGFTVCRVYLKSESSLLLFGTPRVIYTGKGRNREEEGGGKKYKREKRC